MGISTAMTVSKTFSASTFWTVVFPWLSVYAILGAFTQFSHVKVGSTFTFGSHRKKHLGGWSWAGAGTAKQKVRIAVKAIFMRSSMPIGGA